MAPAAPGTASPAHLAGACPCLAAGGWCHGVRAATTDPATITAWWRREPRAVPGVAAGPSGLVLVDIDAHGGPPPPNLATGLLPGIDLTAEPIPPGAWDDPARFRDGRDSLTLLARLRGGPRPWPTGPEHQPVTAATPSGGVHLWYRAPAPNLRQALSDPHGRYGLAWQIDLKAGWSYGIAPGAATTAGPYPVRGGDPAQPGRMPAWLAHEVIRATTTARTTAARHPAATIRPAAPGPAAYLATVIARGAAQLAALTDGRKRALSALAYHAGGLLTWSGARPRAHHRPAHRRRNRRRPHPRSRRAHRPPCHYQRHRAAGETARLPPLTPPPDTANAVSQQDRSKCTMPATRTHRPADDHTPRDTAAARRRRGALREAGPASEDTWLTVDQLCAELHIARSTFYDWRAKGRAPKCHKLPNGDIRIRRADYERWLADLGDAA